MTAKQPQMPPVKATRPRASAAPPLQGLRPDSEPLSDLERVMLNQALQDRNDLAFCVMDLLNERATLRQQVKTLEAKIRKQEKNKGAPS